MLFNSLHFALFFLLVTIIYFMLPYNKRWFWLLLSSCYFYMVFLPIYILILGFTIVIDYIAGIYLERTKGRKRKIYLIASLIANVGVLAVFKYYNFLNENLSYFLNSIGYQNTIPNLSILLPIGLSFHTFQAMSYTIEVYRGNQKAEKRFGIYALYVMFFPQLVAGPIERPQNMLHQFHCKYDFDYSRVAEGLKLILWGIFKKVVIADRLAIYVNSVYNNQSWHGGITLIIATIFFAIQIYCDFSGYSDIALGSARVLGFKLMTNFRRPYFSRSIHEFWGRWHISLSSWFRDYLYIPLGGSRVSKVRWNRNLLIVFLVSGLWHGASWNYIIWGGLHGAFLISGNLLRKYLDQIAAVLKSYYTVLSYFCTFSLVCFAWIFFRANSFSDAMNIINSIIHLKGKFFLGNPASFVYSLLVILILFAVEFKTEFLQKLNFSILYNSNKIIRFAGYSTLIILILMIGVFNGSQFIYFQF